MSVVSSLVILLDLASSFVLNAAEFGDVGTIQVHVLVDTSDLCFGVRDENPVDYISKGIYVETLGYPDGKVDLPPCCWNHSTGSNY